MVVKSVMAKGYDVTRGAVVRLANRVPSPKLHRLLGQIPQAASLMEISLRSYLTRKGIEVLLKGLGYIPKGERLSGRYYRLIQQTGRELGITLQKPADLVAVATHIESQRRVVAQAAFDQIETLTSLTADKLSVLRPVERKWLEVAAKQLAPLADLIYDRQCLEGAPQEQQAALLRQGGHPASLAHFARIRTPQLPLLRPSFIPKSVPNHTDFASSLPWFPDGPSFSAMWPKDLTKAELDFIIANFPSEHLIRRPYSVVERLDLKTAAAILRRGLLTNSKGEQVEAIVKGKDGVRYRVINICFHEGFQPIFTRLAKELKETAKLEVEGEKLPREFKHYLSEVAESMLDGDFTRWIKADIAQKGKLFFTFFPHEGYWPDNMKFPFLFAIGVVDQQMSASAEDDSIIVRKLEERTAQVAKNLDMRVSSGEGGRQEITRFVWTYKEAGYLSSFPHAVASGHDYPKVFFPGVNRHVTVVIMDSLAASTEARKGMMAALFGAEAAQAQKPEYSIQFVKWHEAQHGIVGNKPDTVRKDGNTMGAALGDDWGIVAEPGADIGSLVAAKIKFELGQINEEEMKGTYMNALFRAIISLQPKQVALGDGFVKEAIHSAGIMLFIGSLFKTGEEAVSFNNKGILEVNFNTYLAAVKELDEKLIGFGLDGSIEQFMAFYRENVEAIPENFIARVREIVGSANRMYLVARPGDA